MRTRHHILTVLLVLYILFLTACSPVLATRDRIFTRFRSEDRMDAAVETVDLFFKALMAKDYEKAYSFIAEDADHGRGFDAFRKEMLDVTEIIDIKTNWVEVKDNIAIVGIDITDEYDGSEKLYKDIEVSLVSTEDGWKINFWQ